MTFCNLLFRARCFALFFGLCVMGLPVSVYAEAAAQSTQSVTTSGSPATVAPAPTVTFSASPATVASGASAVLSWSSSHATSCAASGGWTGTLAVSGSYKTPALSASQTYTLACTGPGGTVTRSAAVTVAPAPTVTFSATPATVASGANSVLSWSSSNATSCTASGGWTGARAASGTYTVPAMGGGSASYTLVCAGVGGPTTRTVMVSVAAVLPQPPLLPKAYVDTTYAPPAGKVTSVPTGSDPVVNGKNLQTAINNASLGDTLVLQAGAIYSGNFMLPVKTAGSGWIYVVSSDYAELPAPGHRVAPSDAVHMAKLVFPYGNNGSGIETVPQASHYRFVGIETTPKAGIYMNDLFRIGNGEKLLTQLPSDITIDRCYIHGDPIVGSKRGVAMNGIRVAVIDSYISEFMSTGQDTQAVWAYNTPGPLKISNNYLEAAGENVMFGGADPAIPNEVPSDITVTNNYINKPLAWMSAKPAWDVKNLFELKNAQRILVQGNLMTNHWGANQPGFAVVFTPRNQDNTALWSIVQDVTFQNNVLQNIAGGINIAGTDDINVSQLGYRELIQNNLLNITGLSRDGLYDGIGRSFQILNRVQDLSVTHNTAFNSSRVGNTDLISMDVPTAKDNRLLFSNNMVSLGVYGVFGSNVGGGTVALNAYVSNWTFTNNVMIVNGAIPSAASYPAGNHFANLSSVGFVNYATGNYQLLPTSPFKGAATDGTDIGANIPLLANATACALTGSAPNVSSCSANP